MAFCKWIAKHKTLVMILTSLILVLVGVAKILLDIPFFIFIIIMFLITFFAILIIGNAPILAITKSVNHLARFCDPYPLLKDTEELLKYEKKPGGIQQLLIIDYCVALQHTGELQKAHELLSGVEIDKYPSMSPIHKFVYYNNLGSLNFLIGDYDKIPPLFQKIELNYNSIKSEKHRQMYALTMDSARADFCFVNGEYETVLRMLDSMNPPQLCFAVETAMLYAKTYLYLGENDKAREKLQFVISNGNRLYCVEVARELLERLDQYR